MSNPRIRPIKKMKPWMDLIDYRNTGGVMENWKSNLDEGSYQS
jgi:hypothetical protein